MIITNFNDLEWTIDTIPTSSHFIALSKAINERLGFVQAIKNNGIIYEATHLPKILPYDTIKLEWVNDFIGVLNNWVYNLMLDPIEEWEIIVKDETKPNGLIYFYNSFLLPTDIEIPVANTKSQQLVSLTSSFEKAIVSALPQRVSASPFTAINYKAVMSILIKYKDFLSKLNCLYILNPYSLDEEFSNWRIHHFDGEPDNFSIPSWVDVQYENSYISDKKLTAWWYRDYEKRNDGFETWDEDGSFDCTTCGLPFVFKMPAKVFAHVTAERHKSTYTEDGIEGNWDELTDEWYYDFGTGLNAGWNELGFFKQGDIVSLLPNKGFGAEKSTNEPSVRNTPNTIYSIDWNLDALKIDFSDSLNFKVTS